MSAEELGGAELHCATSGVADHLAEGEAHAAGIARRVLANLGAAGAPAPAAAAAAAAARDGRGGAAAWEEPLYPAEELRGSRSALRVLLC